MIGKAALALLAFCVAFAPVAQAQVGLPLPNVGGLGDVLEEVPDTVGRTGENLREVRRLQVRDLLRRNRATLEVDPQGFPIVRSQIIALSMNEAALAAAQRAGFQIVQRDEQGEFGAMVTLRAPANMSTRRALARLRQADPNGVYDFDHLHMESGAALSALPALQAGAVAGPRIGLIDGGVAASTAGLIEQRGFATQSAVASNHATAVATLIRSTAPGARLYVADIYGGAPTGGASSALARALAWLAGQGTPVINVSLVGPRNRVVEGVIAQLVGRGFVVVAAVGNDGPAAAPLFPAAYPGVIGVTGVDARNNVLIEAGRGDQVDFAALGLHRDPRVRGTSFAAPIVTALIAQRMNAPNTAQARQSVEFLNANARDLGRRGRDNVYGAGLVSNEITAAARP